MALYSELLSNAFRIEIYFYYKNKSEKNFRRLRNNPRTTPA